MATIIHGHGAGGREEFTPLLKVKVRVPLPYLVTPPALAWIFFLNFHKNPPNKDLFLGPFWQLFELYPLPSPFLKPKVQPPPPAADFYPPPAANYRAQVWPQYIVPITILIFYTCYMLCRSFNPMRRFFQGKYLPQHLCGVASSVPHTSLILPTCRVKKSLIQFPTPNCTVTLSGLNPWCWGPWLGLWNAPSKCTTTMMTTFSAQGDFF